MKGLGSMFQKTQGFLKGILSKIVTWSDLPLEKSVWQKEWRIQRVGQVEVGLGCF